MRHPLRGSPEEIGEDPHIVTMFVFENDPSEWPHNRQCPWCLRSQKHHENCVVTTWVVEMPYGRHKGKPMDMLDTSYLVWVWTTSSFSADLKAEARRLLVERGEKDPTGELTKMIANYELGESSHESGLG
jgi:hypothetical protein